MNTAYRDCPDRRTALRAAGLVGISALLVARPVPVVAAGKKEDIPATEDLMREHGVLNRVLLCYEEILRRIPGGQDFDPAALSDSARVIHDFIEDYHEKQEEDFLFPRFKKAGKLTDLVDTLKTQHDAGRRLTGIVLDAAPNIRKDEAARQKAISSLTAFIRMYRPHEAREDTVLFPAVRSIVSPHEFDSLGEDFEKNEHKKFGGDGFDIYVDKVAAIEKTLGIADLNRVTPA